MATLETFNLYETQSNYYMIGRDVSWTVWRVLRIDRSEPSELRIHEEPKMFSEIECHDFLNQIHEGNRSTGGLKFVTECYGIIGFVRFLGPYYMLLITKRRRIGAICGHIVYAISKSKMIVIPNSTVQSTMAYSKDEKRYKKLLCKLDLKKDFFFSYSYNVMHSFQKNICDGEIGDVQYESMFVWNEFLTRPIRKQLKNTMWTVALVYGFFKQGKLPIAGKDVKLTLIARRSRHFAGTRYLKRGLNEKGRVANDVETEQIVFEDTFGEIPTQISSVVQNRGSIPLFWSQEASWLNIKPDIILYKKDHKYEATRLHFDNLVKRYGNPIIILNLIKSLEKKPRESILFAEFAKAIDYLNKDLSGDNRVICLHRDLHRLRKHSWGKARNVLAFLDMVMALVLDSTGFFYSQVTPDIGLQSSLNWSTLVQDNGREDNLGNFSISRSESVENLTESEGISLAKPPMFQTGVLRTNCIDCLDRTNIAQFSYGLAALGRQLHALGFADVPKVDLDNPLADHLLHFYEKMGDTLSLQYGGSAAHNEIFSEIRGHWKATIRSRELFRSIQRYCSNTYMDAVKQDAINVFLGYFQPQQGKPALWELGSDQHYNVGRCSPSSFDENTRLFVKRSISDSNILCESNTCASSSDARQKKLPNSLSRARVHHLGDAKDRSDSLPNMTIESGLSNSCWDMSCIRGVSAGSKKLGGYTVEQWQLFADIEYGYSNKHGFDASNCSSFLDLSSSRNSCEEIYDRFSAISTLVENRSAEIVSDATTAKSTSTLSEKGGEETEREPYDRAGSSSGPLGEFSDTFVHWVDHESAFFR